jgi:hypothetical protein
MPALLFLILLAGFTASAIPTWEPFVIIAHILFGAAGVAFLGVVSASVWNLIQKRWAKGIISALLVLACGVAAVLAAGFLMIAFMFGPSEDGFADNLEIPAGAEIVEPGKELDAQPGLAQDAFQAALLGALRTPGNEDAAIPGEITSLWRLQENHPAILRRYLASSSAWRVFEENGSVFATRRWMIGPEWRYDLHGYYTKHDVETWPDAGGLPDFQSRFTIGLSGKPWWRGNKDTTWLKNGETVVAALSPGNQMQQSHCVISAGTVVVEVFEQSGARERRLTKAALDFLQAELEPLAGNPTWETAHRILAPGSTRKGSPSFEIRNSFQPGLYDSIIWLNPGEPGMAYLKAFEVTKGTPLSVDRLKDKTNEWIGWSDDPEEVFFSNTHFTIYEGDWGNPYAARLEVWFSPDSGGPDRRLLDRVFKIEGWQR